MAGEVIVAPWQGVQQPEGGAGVVRVLLRHEGRLNAMTRAMWLQLRSVFEVLARTPELRCVLIEGEGEAFCAGGDISEYPGFRFDAAQLRHFPEQEVWGGLSAMLACDVPIVARIAGACMGAGVEIASCCDIRIAADTARFGAPIAKLGFPMAPREAQLVAGAVGETIARQMLLETHSAVAVCAMVAAGLGVAWLPSSLLEGNVCGVPLHGGTYRRRIGLCYAPDMRELPAVSALLAAFAEAEPAAG